LLHESEALQKTGHEKLLLAGSRDVEWGWLENQLIELQRVALSRDVEKIMPILHDLVPEFTPCSHLDGVAKSPVCPVVISTIGRNLNSTQSMSLT